MPRIKGTALLDAIASLEQRVGRERYEALVTLIPEPHRGVFQNEIYPTAWYSLDAFVGLLRQSLVPNNDDDDALIARSEAVVDRHLRGIYRVFVKLGSPAFVLKRISAVHQTYFSGVQIEMTFGAKGEATARYIGFEPQHQLLEKVIIGFYRRALELCGAERIRVSPTVRIDEGRDHCEFAISWH